MRQNIGVGTFARQYGGRNKRKGAVPEHFAKASRGLIRHILKQVRAPCNRYSSPLELQDLGEAAAILVSKGAWQQVCSSGYGLPHSCPAAQALAL